MPQYGYRFSIRLLIVAIGFGFVACAPNSLLTSTFAQEEDALPAIDLGGAKRSAFGSRLFGTDNDAQPMVAVSIAPTDAKPGDEVTLRIAVDLPPGNYTYSTNKSFIGNTKIKVADVKGLGAVDPEFVADSPPKAIYEPLFKKTVEKHLKDVTWSRKFRLLPDTKPTDASLKLLLDYQVCNENRCLPLVKAWDIALASGTGKSIDPKNVASATTDDKPIAVPPQPAPLSFTLLLRPLIQGSPGPAQITAKIDPENAKPGDTVTFSIGIQLDPEWHTYSITMPNGQAAVPTSIKIAGLNGLTALDESFKASSEPKVKETTIGNATYRQEVHEDEITWIRRYKVESADYGLSGSVKYQTCTGENCLLAKTVQFALGNAPQTSTEDLVDTAASLPPAPLSDEPLQLQEIEVRGGSLGFYLFSAFVGGLLLNIMPCVLPVLAIKVLSFVKQAGESRGRIFMLNLAYALGVIGVFLALATLAVSLQKGWGELFQNSEFNLIMACLVFAMGLSLLGVFEIPVPGLVGSAAGSQSQDGLLGAFLTGILATLLATPCSGPFMGATLAWSVRETPAITYLIWGVMGLGMASPYLVFGLFPQLLRWLPKPGAWMERFKEFSGFVLMGSVIFIITFLDRTYTIPLLIMLLGIALGLWMIGNLYDVSSHIRHKNLVRFSALTFTVLICGFGFWMARPASAGDVSLPWEPFSEARLNELRQQNKTVLIDFTADWCLVCKTNEFNALNTPETLEIVRRHDVVTLVADYTDPDEEIKRWLNKFDSVSVPLTVIFPGSRPNQPILIRDLFSKKTLLEKLNEAVDQRPIARGETRTDVSAAIP